MFQPRTILHPTDYSACARQAFEVAVDLARHHRSHLIVLHVAVTLGPEAVSHGQAVSQLQPEAVRRDLLAQLRQVRPAEAVGLTVRHILAEGDPGEVIAETARTEGCDLIVMGTYGRSALSQFLTGSVTHKVTRLAPCAVMLMRTPEGS
jgi:nucleotide-binding universal stress UspA family protein